MFHVFQKRRRPRNTRLSEAEHQMLITGTPVTRNTFGVPRFGDPVMGGKQRRGYRRCGESGG